MPTSCCVPQCNQQGFTTPTGEKAGKGYHKDITEPQILSWYGDTTKSSDPPRGGQGRIPDF